MKIVLYGQNDSVGAANELEPLLIMNGSHGHLYRYFQYLEFTVTEKWEQPETPTQKHDTYDWYIRLELVQVWLEPYKQRRVWMAVLRDLDVIRRIQSNPPTNFHDAFSTAFSTAIEELKP